MKKIISLLLVLVLVLSLAACGGTDEPKKSGAKKIGLVLGTGGLGDKNFNDMAYEGITSAEKELGISFDYLEPATVTDYVPNLRSMCETGEYDLVIGLGTDMCDAIKEVAADFPDQKFSHIDSTLEGLENVSAISTKWQEQTFMAGVVAGLGTKSDLPFANEDNVIGVIIGQENPSLRKGVIGYTAGARYVNPDVKVLEGNVDSFNDPGTAKEMSLSMFSQGADFIQAIAGASGMGIYSASNEAQKYSFGVGANVNDIQPDNIVGTSARTVNLMVYNEIKALLDGTWSGGLHISGIKEGAVGYDATKSNVKLPDDVQAAVTEIEQMLKDGKLVPPENAEDIDAWVAENQYKK